MIFIVGLPRSGSTLVEQILASHSKIEGTMELPNIMNIARKLGNSTKDRTAYIFLILTTLFWSGNFIVGKAASFFEIPPFTLNFYRWTFAWLILAPFTLKEIVEKKNYIFEMRKGQGTQ